VIRVEESRDRGFRAILSGRFGPGSPLGAALRGKRKSPGGSLRAARVFKEEHMPGGRPPKGPELVDGLEGSADAKARLRAALATLVGTKTIAEACEELGLKEAMLHVLRKRALQGALAALEAKPLGRPRKRSEEAGEREALERENAALRWKLKEAELREELMAALPALREKVKESQKKTNPRPRKR
jgi:hypothetical protein